MYIYCIYTYPYIYVCFYLYLSSFFITTEDFFNEFKCAVVLFWQIESPLYPYRD